MALLEKLLGKKADELRKRMERSILVSKKLTDKLDADIESREASTAAMESLTAELKLHRKILEKLLEEVR